MPGIFHQPINRRRFLGHSARVLALLALSKPTGVLAQEAADANRQVHLALLSDTHVPADSKNEYRKFLPWDNLKTVVPQVIDSRPEGVILNGDAARLTGELADYEAVKQLLAPIAERAPVYIGLGNHDDRDNFFKVFDHPSGNRQKVAGKHVLVIELPFMRLILLDSLFYVNKAAGLLGKTQREWLARYLDESDVRPIVIFVHHTLGDGDGDLLDVERLFRLTRSRKTVKAIIYGHSHKYAFNEEEGIHLINIPAVGYNFSDDEPVGWVDAVFTAKGADLKLRAFAGNRAADGKSRSLTWRS